MDIRKWLIAPKPNSAASSSSGHSKNDAKSKKSETDRKKSEKVGKKRRIIESDSDEDPLPKDVRESSSKKSPDKKSSSSKAVEKQKEVSVSDFFGSAPVSRSHKSELPKKKKLNEVVVVHDDDDFEATLSQLDKQPTKKHKGMNGKTKAHSENENKDTKKESTKVKTQDKPPSKKVSTESEEKAPSKKVSTESEEKNPSKKVSTESQEKAPSKKISTESSDKTSPKGEKKSSEKGKTSSKRKSEKESLVKMEIVPNPKTPKTEKKEIKEDKPVAKKPRASGGANYASYLHREGPRALGSKEIPEGEEDCFAGLTFLITGVLESLERDEAKALIEKYGGKVMSTLSKNTKYLVVGRDAGASKLAKAESLGTKQVDEDGLLDLIKTLPGKSGSKKKHKSSVESKKSEESKTTPPSKKSQVGANPLNTSSIEDEFEMDVDDDLFDIDISCGDSTSTKTRKSDEKKSEKKSPIKSEEKLERPKEDKVMKDTKSSTTNLPTSMWVDKYKPSSLKQIIGQQGDNSNAKKLLRWLLNWHKSRKLNKKPGFGRFNPSDDGSAYKAALLSGPPGVGKTTTTVLVCKEAGFDYFELNASDTRSKKNLQQAVSQLLGNQTLGNCFKENGGGKVTENHVIVMDEVDGMAGNEDRGGMAELIAFIKASKVPIICICNDRNHTKIRSLSNHCFDLRFQRPRVEQIKAAMMSIAFKEKIQVSQEVLQDVIVASNQDIRQVLHNMSMWSAKAKGLSSDQTKSDIGRGTKHIKMGPFDVLREVFAIGNKPKASIIDKSDLFFHDYSIAPLFVQENYVHVIPTDAQGDKQKHLSLLSEAADSICIGDVIEKQIRSQSSWGLLPTQAIFSSVVPGELLKGHLKQMINFPAWLGKNSNKNHMDRVLQELHVHMRMKVTGNKTDIALEYLPLMKRALTKPLVDDESAGVPQVLKTMEEYYLLREDFDSIIELSLWPGQIDPRTKIQTKVKSAFTRAYNKESGKNPYAVTNVKKKKASAKEETELGEEDAVESEEEDDSIEKDAMIKVKKPSKKESTAASGEPSTSSGKKKAASSKKGKSK